MPVSTLLGETREPVRVPPVEAGAALCRALTDPVAGDAPRRIVEVRDEIRAAWQARQSSPSRYSAVGGWLPRLVVDTERSVRAAPVGDRGARRHANRCAADLYGLVRTRGQADGPDRPKVHDAFTVCNAMGEHIEDVAVSFRDIATACSDFADGIERAHHDVAHELTNLLEWTAGIEAGGALLSLISFGAAEGGAQVVEAARVAVTAGRVGKIIQTLTDLAGTLARAIGSVFSRIGKVAQRLLRIERAEVNDATVSAAAKTPEAADTTEATAVDGLGDAAQAAARIDQSAATFNANEMTIATRLAEEGKQVTAVPRSATRTPDADVDGVPTEFKTVESETPTSGTVRNTLNSSAKNGGQARNIIIDSREAPLTQAEAERGIQRFVGQGKDAYDTITIWGDGWTITWPHS